MEKINGLNPQEVLSARLKYGQNRIAQKKENAFFRIIRDLGKEPMFLLLLAAAIIYFISGQAPEGIFMGISIVLVATISIYQDARSRNALDALKKLTKPNAYVIREGEKMGIPLEDIVMGDIMIVEEGSSIPADGTIIQSNDFAVNESILTGESFPVIKNETAGNNLVFQGTTVSGGLALARVQAIGNMTKLAQIGKQMETIKVEKTPLQQQISNFVKKMAAIGIIVFFIVWALNYSSSRNILDSLLKALTLAMSILPEEIPVAFTTFMALGAWRLMKMGIIVKQTTTVETLGSASVICIDKTGTITENRMSLAEIYSLDNDQLTHTEQDLSANMKHIIKTGMWASEPIPFDPMELALHESYGKITEVDERPSFKMVHEYPLSGVPPMMTHIFENGEGKRILAAKGAPEAIMEVCVLSAEEHLKASAALNALSQKGYRVLAVATAVYEGDQFPATQQEFKFGLQGLIAFYDPPRKNFSRVLQSFYEAGIDVKIITGDNALTTATIARQIGFRGADKSLDGVALMNIPPRELNKTIAATNIFTRMFPEAKLTIVNALKEIGKIVAMTGDGVNDGPALKAAHIGIAMGDKGSEIAKRAASLVLTDDDLEKMATAIAMGRRIYTNLKKAIRYIISIHIPIILTVFIPLALGWVYPNIFTPVHIIFLELIMGPTCSIIYENDPMESNVMQQPPRPMSTTFFNWHEISVSILQGLVITAAALLTYQYAVIYGKDENTTRTMVFLVLISANIFLTLVNRSFYYSVFTTAGYANYLVRLIIGITISLVACLLLIPFLTVFFKFSQLPFKDLFFSLAIGFLSVIWFEIVKWISRKKNKT
ncbi:cation-translocating P-type ATPase [Flavihumibacter profundi]|uniref:cation-translocating P-type ATPase n=1 Tax=Flavihumibacter profundi TaxID=2716883 RepID=UPI001CC67BDC|nr:cation-translocating P-type ATPase [Flavihumibacter profundi]MBZ5855966.1 cation-translocating P-type ATPase [Flavihumibacter profundi]